jgi:hypothetical protein
LSLLAVPHFSGEVSGCGQELSPAGVTDGFAVVEQVRVDADLGVGYYGEVEGVAGL